MNSIKKRTQNSGLFFSFNQNFSCLSVGSKKGYQIYNCDPFRKCYSKYKDLGISIVEMLFSTTLVAIVCNDEKKDSSQTRLIIANINKNSIICELKFASPILAVKINRKNLVIVLEEFIYIYDIVNMHLLKTFKTCPNPNAICSLSPSSDNCYLAYPDGTKISGDLVVYDAIQMQKVCIISAHKTTLGCMQFNNSGNLIATASEKGTIIRVFSSQVGNLLYQFRRGIYPAHIYSLSFNLSDTFLGVSSDSNTIHIFKLDENKNNIERELKGKKRSSLIKPDALNTIIEPHRDFAFAKIPPQSKGVKNICAFSNNTQIMVAVDDGKFYKYILNIKKGGECILTTEDSFLDS